MVRTGEEAMRLISTRLSLVDADMLVMRPVLCGRLVCVAGGVEWHAMLRTLHHVEGSRPEDTVIASLTADATVPRLIVLSDVCRQQSIIVRGPTHKYECSLYLPDAATAV